MKRLLLPVLLVLNSGWALAQPYGNEWINYSRQYWRFEIVTEGIYRIDSAALANAGFPVSSIDPHDLQLFAREQQVPIYVEGEADGVFNSGDYIEFYAKGNDGWKDVPMYDDPSHQANPYFSQINDTLRYFLTWDAGPQKLRIAPYNNTAYGSYGARPWFSTESVWSFNDAYQKGERNDDDASNAYMVKGEGWFSTVIGNSAPGTVSFTQYLSTPQPYQLSSPPAQATLVIASINNPGGNYIQDHHSRVYVADNYMGEATWRGYAARRFDVNVPQIALSTLLTPFKVDIIHDMDSLDAAYPDRQAWSWFRIRYAHTTIMGNASSIDLGFDEDAANAVRLDFDQFFGTPLLYTFNSDSVRRSFPTWSGSVWQMLAPADPLTDSISAYLHSLESIQNITAIVPVTASGYFTEFANAPVDSALLIVTHAALMNQALAYANDREMSPVNPHQTLVADVDELYDQYAGGVERHPWGIRAWCDEMLDELPTPPQGLFLIGKSVQAPRFNTTNLGYRTANDTLGRRLLRVPSFGYPPSDVCFTLGLQGDPRVLEIPVGRLAAYTQQEVNDYRNKVLQFESYVLPEPWMKNILHFRGGFNSSEWSQFNYYLSDFEAIAENDTSFAGHVTTFRKNSDDIIAMASADSVANLINEGVSLMTFFAHASGSGFDINIDNINNYDWNGHYPMVIGNSCYSGNIHLTTSNSSSEQFVLPQAKGAVAFLASVDVGYAHQLFTYCHELYRSFSRVNYGGSIGEHMKHAVYEELNSGMDLITMNNAQTFTLHGDPTLVLNSFGKPDLSITDEDVFFDPASVTADIDTFTVNAVVTNIGRGTGAPVVVKLERTLQDGTVMEPMFTTIHLAWQDTARFEVPVLADAGGTGNNHFHVSVDLDPNDIDEMDDFGNNEADRDLVIASGDIVPVWPYEFAITPDMQPMLKASTLDPFAPVKSYYFQIDTTDAFNSPMMQQAIISAPGGVVSWQPPGIYSLNTLLDSVVYFWRVSRDTVGFGGGNYSWFESSFQCLDNRTGWGQSHFFQFEENNFSTLIYDKPGRELEYDAVPHNMSIDLWGWCTGSLCNDSEVRIDLNDLEYGGCQQTPAWHVVVIDPTDLQPWGTNYGGANPDHDFGNVNEGPPCRSRVENFFIFRHNNTAQLDGMEDMLTNQVPDGHYLLIYTWKYLSRSNLATFDPDNSLENVIVGLGASDLPSVPDSVPYIFFVRKGYPGSVAQVMGTNDVTPDAPINLSVWITALGNFGTMSWPMAGPAYEWDALYWNEVPRNPQDSTRIKLTGVRADLSEQFILDLPSEQDSLPDIEVYADSQYPYLDLNAFFYDDSALLPEPAQLKRWQLLASPAPECAIDPPSGFLEAVDGLYEGQPGKVMVAVRNIGDVDMDSLLMTAWVTDADNVLHRIHYKRNAPLPVGATLLDTIDIATAGMEGVNYLRIEANPVDTITDVYDQLEQTHVNNIAELRFDIDSDDENPVLDVTFDGIHILENDIVSVRPEIRVTLDDENPTLLFDNMEDTVHFKVFLTPPSGAIERIYFYSGGLEVLQFVPADGPDNICHIDYRPVFTEDGIYTLQVQASDISYNMSGDEEYKVSFEVINRPTITNVLNYPNPFTTSTRFVFTITGQEPPTQMKIQIYTVSGRVVRTIDLAELGPLHIGRNLTQYAWDGTDDFGDKLARGVYLYRVYARLNGEEIEHRETSADSYFTKGFGKMYLLR